MAQPPASAPAASVAPAQPASGQKTSTPAAATTAAPATPAEIRKLKLKLDGQDVELEESEVIARAQRSSSSDKRFQEAAAMRKQAEDVIRFAKENPKEFFARTGMNARQWAEEYLIEELKREQMTPEQRKASENEAKLKQFEDEKKQAAAKKLEDEKAAMQAKHHENYDKMFVEALGKSGLPRTAYTIKRMAELQLVNLKKKLELSPDQLAKVVREDYIAEQKTLFSALDGEQIMEFLGPELVKKLSKAQIAKLKANSAPKQGGAPRASTTDKPGMTWKEYQRRNRRLT